MSRSTMEAPGGRMGRDFGGRVLSDVLRYVQDCAPDGTLGRIFAAAGEPRPPAALLDANTWSSYAQYRALVEATSEVLALDDDFTASAQHVFNRPEEPELLEALQALGSPDAVLASMPMLTPRLSPAATALTSHVGPNEWLIDYALRAEFAPFRSNCGLQAALYALVPRMFGAGNVTIVEETCQCDGAPACRYRLAWHEGDDVARRAEFYELRAQLLDARLEHLHRLVETLATAADPEVALEAIVGGAVRAVSAHGAVLGLVRGLAAPRRVYHHGFDDPETALRLAEAVEAGDTPDDPGSVVVEIRSASRLYGRLTVIGAGQHITSAPGVIGTYARLAAAFMDSVRQATTTRVLLELSTSLAELATPDEMAARLARATPDVVDCDRAAVFLADGAGEVRLAAAAGYGDDALAALAEPATIAWLAAAPVGVLTRRDAREACVVVPIASGAETLGWILAAVDDDVTAHPHGDVDVDVPQRLGGLAHQAAVALDNARLLDRVRHQALHDALTGLANRALLLDRVDQLLARGRRNHSSVAALFLDLDGFKDVNDVLGHDAGDELLRAVAGRLTAALRDVDTVGRLGGDEFVVLVDATMDAGPELVAERILKVMREPFALEGMSAPLTITASIGIAVGDRATGGELLRDADIALYRAKEQGKDGYVVFRPEMQTAVQDHLLLEMDLRSALDAGEFFLVYQPIFELPSGRTTGVEALVRWQHPERGRVEPGQFIPALEASGLIVDVGRWVLHEACREAARWHGRGLGLDVSVNVSVRQLERPCFVDDVRAALERSGLTAEALVLEITETALMRDVAGVVPRLEALKALGVRIAIDDFGTGYSSLAYVQQFPVDTLKIDRSFVAAMADSEESTALIRSLVHLGKSLGLRTLAEGIERPDQYAQLRDEACDSGQGFLVARPLEAQQLEAFLEREVSRAG